MRLASCFFVCLAICGAALAQEAKLYFGHSGEVRDYNTKAFTDFSSPTETYTTNGIAFRLHYEDVRQNLNQGFDDPADGAAARQRLKDVLDEVAGTVHETGTLDVHVEASQSDGSGFLAQCGTFWSVSSGVNDPSSLMRIENGTKPFAGTPEIFLLVDFGFNYNLTSGATISGQSDFFSVLLHEFGHGLGFASLCTVTGASAFGTNVRTSYDANLVRGQGGSNLFNSSGLLVGNVTDLISADLFFEGTNATTGYNQGVQPGIFAPVGFLSGSSLSHWNTGNIVGGAVMEHTITSGTDRRAYTPVDVGGLKDIGWSNAAEPGSGTEGEGEGVVEGEGEGEPAPTTVSITSLTPTMVEEGDLISLAANVQNGVALSYQWLKGSQVIPLEVGPTFIRISAQLSDEASYRVRVTTAGKAVITSEAFPVFVAPSGLLPVGGALALGAVTAGCALLGALGLRRRK